MTFIGKSIDSSLLSGENYLFIILGGKNLWPLGSNFCALCVCLFFIFIYYLKRQSKVSHMHTFIHYTMNQKVNNCLSCPLNYNCFFILILYMSAFEDRPRPAHSHQLLILGCVLMASSDLDWLIPDYTHHWIRYILRATL